MSKLDELCIQNLLRVMSLVQGISFLDESISPEVFIRKLETATEKIQLCYKEVAKHNKNLAKKQKKVVCMSNSQERGCQHVQKACGNSSAKVVGEVKKNKARLAATPSKDRATSEHPSKSVVTQHTYANGESKSKSLRGGTYNDQPFQMYLRSLSGESCLLTKPLLAKLKEWVQKKEREGYKVFRIGMANHFLDKPTNDLDVVMVKDLGLLWKEQRGTWVLIGGEHNEETLSIDYSIITENPGSSERFNTKLKGTQTAYLASGFRQLYVEKDILMLGELILPDVSMLTADELSTLQAIAQFKLYPCYGAKLLTEVNQSSDILALKKHFCFLMKLIARHLNFSDKPSLLFITQYTCCLKMKLAHTEFALFDRFLFDYMDGYREGLGASLFLLSTNIDIGIKVWALSMLNFWAILKSQVSGLLLSSSSSLEGVSASI